MRIARFLNGGKVITGQVVDAHSARPIDGDLFGDHQVSDKSVAIEKLLAPLVPTDILCIGLNYREHANESKSAIPVNPMLFIKSSNALNNPFDPVLVPRRSSQIDYESELCVVIGKTAKHVSREQALDYVFGYTCANDVSARDWQRDKALGGGQFARGKSFDGFCPLGPWIVTKDEIPNPNALRIRGLLNGQVMQDHTTGDMIFDVPTLIESLSSTMTLRPGTVILTGTPQGVGFARTPPVWLKAGDRFVVEIEKIGSLENPIVNEG
ncbi:MAG TPA: fumarylacetoacetate hydrolase family protein [Tepidisphaeraceae bacterium]|jgi:2-keto-4-pentenoate hydratase/2-oxohepta-3-ene-1,7-dioic acid hydratase in catechol pathway|nr:fumarylacetoacetate hydrolase family protein [Tepidisphaeraceae bacterium]